MFATLTATLTLALELAGFFLALRAVLIARTPQSAVAWSVGLIVFPLLAIPLFLVFGESQFGGYLRAVENPTGALGDLLKQVQAGAKRVATSGAGPFGEAASLGQRLSGLPATGGNNLKLLVDGEETFQAVFEAIDKAERSLWIQFFIIRDDRLGKALADRVGEAAARGVDCRVLFDQVGSKTLRHGWVESLRRRGVRVEAFITNRQFGRRFQINFRNHRKLVLADAQTAFVGGLNVGDEYMGGSPRFGPWRDTHLRIEGPAAQMFQVSFAEDWHYVTGEVLTSDHEQAVGAGPAIVLPVASGPAEMWSVCPAVYLSVIQNTRERLWMASPYFVPSSPLMYALCHAALRGVDVRLLLPQMADHTLPWLSSFTFYPKLRAAGVRVWRYQPGFMHQKVLLSDRDTAIVGSVNLDYRSFMLNFELAAAIQDPAFAQTIENMWIADLAKSREEDLRAFEDGSLAFRLKCRLAALMSPEQ